ncbi:MAG: hypothetical protein JSS07_05620 [Proteobacteria bacterium]|nr:hypothetical protein [Pseudomonadota bacterium]
MSLNGFDEKAAPKTDEELQQEVMIHWMRDIKSKPKPTANSTLSDENLDSEYESKKREGYLNRRKKDTYRRKK